MEHAARWIEQYRQFWDGQLDSLAKYLEEPAQEEFPPGEATGNARHESEEMNTP